MTIILRSSDPGRLLIHQNSQHLLAACLQILATVPSKHIVYCPEIPSFESWKFVKEVSQKESSTTLPASMIGGRVHPFSLKPKRFQRNSADGGICVSPHENLRLPKLGSRLDVERKSRGNAGAWRSSDQPSTPEDSTVVCNS